MTSVNSEKTTCEVETTRVAGKEVEGGLTLDTDLSGYYAFGKQSCGLDLLRFEPEVDGKTGSEQEVVARVSFVVTDFEVLLSVEVMPSVLHRDWGSGVHTHLTVPSLPAVHIK